MSSGAAVADSCEITDGVASCLTCPPVFPRRTHRGKGCRTMSLRDGALPVLGWAAARGRALSGAVCEPVPSVGCKGLAAETPEWGGGAGASPHV